MTAKRKVKIILITIATLIAAAILFFVTSNVAISNPFSRLGNGVLSVVFDKAEVLGADKVVLRDGDKSLTITDRKQVRDIARDFVVANSWGLCGYHNDRWIDIYNGDKLVRQIHWNAHDDLAVVYKKDSKHWMLHGSEGQVTLSKKDAQKYNELYAMVK